MQENSWVVFPSENRKQKREVLSLPKTFNVPCNFSNFECWFLKLCILSNVVVFCEMSGFVKYRIWWNVVRNVKVYSVMFCFCFLFCFFTFRAMYKSSMVTFCQSFQHKCLFSFCFSQPRPTKGRMRIHCLENVDKALQFLKEQKVHLENMGSHDIVDGNHRLTLGLIWTIILRFQVTSRVALFTLSCLIQLNFDHSMFVKPNSCWKQTKNLIVVKNA